MSDGAEASARLASVDTMDAVDRAWLSMDQATNPMVVVAVLELEGVRHVRAFADAVADQLLRNARFRQRADETHAPAVWTPVADIDRAYHVNIRRADRHATTKRLREALSREVARPLSRAHPLWRITLFPAASGRATLVFRAHHALADGVALMRLLMEIMESPGPRPASIGAQSTPRKGPLGGVIDRLDAANAVLMRVHAVLRGPGADRELGGALARSVVGGALALARVMTRPDDNPSCLRRPLSGRRRFAWSDPIELAPLKDAAHRSMRTLNDLLLAALAGAFGAYLRGKGSATDGRNLRVSIPVNLRHVADGGMGNRFGLVLLDLPVSVEDPELRRRIVHDRMTRLKQSGEANAVLASLAAVGHLPPSTEKRIVDWIAGKACAVVSNLPGPDHVLEWQGARLVGALFWPPQTGNVGIGISMLSYAGALRLGVSADSGVLEEPELLVRPFQQELETLIGAHPSLRARHPRLVRLPRKPVSGRD